MPLLKSKLIAVNNPATPKNQSLPINPAIATNGAPVIKKRKNKSAPAQKNIPNIIVAYTDALPKSGSIIINAIGIAKSKNMIDKSRIFRTSAPLEDIYLATASNVANFPNSEG